MQAEERTERPRATGVIAKAVRGAFWTILSGTGARVLGILGTLAITHYLSPDEYGETSLAALMMLNAGMLANCGLSQYIAAKPDAGRKAVFHATFYFMVLGVLALGGALVLGGAFADFVKAPGMVKFLPGFALAGLLDRVVQIQDRIQLRDMRFRLVSLQRSLGELVYAVVSVGLAAFAPHTMFGGGFSLVWASVARSVVRLLVLTPTTPWREWIEPHRIEWAQTREFFRFGLPMSVASIAGFGSQKFDNYVFSHHFGPGDCSKYNLAYNFADMPAALIAEQAGDVLVPSFARLEGEKRREGLLLSIRMLVFLVAPLSVGLAMVAPTLVKLAFTPEYDGISKVLRILAMFAIPRTIIWIGNSYLQVRNEPRTIMWLEILRMIGIVVFMHGFIVAAWALRGPHTAIRAACFSVVVVFALSALSYLVVIHKLERASLWSLLSPVVPPLLASAPMAAAVWGVSYLLWARSIFDLSHPIANQIDRLRVFGPRLVIEILVGAIVFIPSAFILAPGPSRELIKLIREARTRRRKGEGDGDEPASEAQAET